MSTKVSTEQSLSTENAELRLQLDEAQEALKAIYRGEVDALVVECATGPQVYTLQSADSDSNRLRGEILSQIGDAVLATDHEQRIIFINPAAERLYCVRADEVLGHKLDQVYTQRNPKTETAVLTAIAKHGKWRGELIQQTPDGRELNVEASITALHDHNGAMTGQLAIIWDITERLRAEASLKAAHDTFLSLVQNSPFGIYVIDFDFRLVQVSKGAHKVFENIKPLLGRDFTEVIKTIWQESFAHEMIFQFHHTLKTGKPFHSLSTAERRHDKDAVESYDWQIERITLPDGRFGVVCHFYDLSERMHYEEKLKANDMALREADRQKNEFLAMLGHELRNPLTPISNIGQIISMQPIDQPTLNWASEILNRNVTHISKLVDDLLDVSRITRGLVKIECQRIELVKLIKESTEAIKNLIQTKQQTLNLELPHQPVFINGDPVRLTQVFANLLNNAAKYTGQSGRIDLMVSVKNPSVIIKVKDNGMGIDPQLMPYLFDLFTQGKQGVDRSEGGLGLGLTLVKKLVELHDGEITVYSPGVNQGSEFTVRLPCLVEETTRTEPDQQQTLSSVTAQGLKVLLIDDNQDIVDSISLWLKMLGHQVKFATDGTQGLKAALKFKPEVIFLDIGLPDFDGYQIARKLRELPDIKSTTLIALSGYSPSDDPNGGKDFDHHLIKPLTLEQLQNVINKCSASKKN